MISPKPARQTIRRTNFTPAVRIWLEPVLLFGIDVEDDRDLDSRVDLPPSFQSRLEFPLLHRFDGGRFELGVRGAHDAWVTDVSFGINHDANDGFPGNTR